MADNNASVILISDDEQLRAAASLAKPIAGVLHCLTAAEARSATPPAASHCWIDLDCADELIEGHWKRRVYFYTRLRKRHWLLPPGMFLPKSGASAVVETLWAEAGEDGLESRERGAVETLGDAPALPAWILDLDGLDLREWCRKCVDHLPKRLGFEEIAVYLHDDDQSILTLAETNSEDCIDLSISTDAESNHVLAEVARLNQVLVANDLAGTCAANQWNCPPYVARGANRAAAIMPLGRKGKLGGVILLIKSTPSATSVDAVPLDYLARFLARRLSHARRYMRARREARVDRLTGLFNDRWMTESLDREIRRAQRFSSPLSLIMLDLDGLKQVNDRLGHLAGDALIRHVARKISSALRQIDSAARIGGDEFVVLLPSTNAAGARRVAGRIEQAIRSDSPVIEGRSVPVSASLGFAQWESGWEARRLREAADKAMYVAKSAGRSNPRPKTAAASVVHAPPTTPTPAGPTPVARPS